MEVVKNINNNFKSKYYKFYNSKNNNIYIIHNNDKTIFYINGKQLCIFKNEININDNLFMILFSITKQFLYINLNESINELNYYDKILNYINDKNEKLKIIIKKYLYEKIDIKIINNQFFDNFKDLILYTCENIEIYCLENNIKIKTYMIDELNNFNNYLIDNINNEEKQLFNNKIKINNIKDINDLYNKIINIININYNNFINKKFNDIKNNENIELIRRFLIDELYEYITNVYNIDIVLIDLYINFFCYFDKFDVNN